MSKRQLGPILFRYAAVAVVAALAGYGLATAQAVSEPEPRTEIILPPLLLAGFPATLATLGADHRLEPHVQVELSNGVHIETDATGRADFPAPPTGVVTARAGAATAAALVDPDSDARAQHKLSVARYAALHNSFNLCGGGFRGSAEENRVLINGTSALILASSPECLVAIPDPKAEPGAAIVSVGNGTSTRRAAVSFVALDFESPSPPLTPGRRGWLTLRVRGSDQRLRILVENRSPDVLRFEKGDAQAITSSGGAQNEAKIAVEAMRSGDFSVHARLAPRSDPEAARRFVGAAESLAMPDQVQTLKKLEGQLGRNSHHGQDVRVELKQMLAAAGPGDLRALLAAALSNL
jgi:hypothetical protein